MVGKIQKGIALIFALLVFQLPSSAQQKEQADSLVRLMKGSSLQLVEINGVPYRKAFDATFLHNGTYLICDTALWNVNSQHINASGHVQIIQDETVLSSERLDYFIDANLAQFRGTVVQLKDKQNNTLRTRFLDYNTKDSVAVFSNGGAMRDKDGQIIESLDGTYDSKIKKFSFRRNVNMFTDSVFVKTSELDYDSETSKAWFNTYIDFWKDENMMSASKGWYDRQNETFFFTGHVHATTEEQESWSDSLYFYRTPNNVLLLGNAQVQDSTRKVAALAERIFYVDSLAKVTLNRRAAVAVRTEEDEKVDTLYFGADTLIYYTMKRCDIPELTVKEAETRVNDMYVDPVLEYRQKAAKAAAEAAAEAAKNDPNRPPVGAKGPLKGGEEKPAEPESSTEPEPSAEPEPEPVPETPPEVSPEASPEGENAVLPEGGQPESPADSLIVLPPPDTTKFGFLEGIHNVRIFRRDIQVLADSLRYNDLDSIARFYINPIVWNEGNRQYSSDSLFTLIKNRSVERASLMSNAFIITQEDSLYFDQIKATEVMAYFDTTAALRRFDALGGASAFFYLEENDAYATMNKVESKMLSAVFKDGEIDMVYYFESPKNDAYPLAQLTMEDQRMRGFNWQDDKRPTSRYDITTLELKPTEREEYARHSKAQFKQTDIYFPGYMESVYKGIERRDSLKRERQREEQIQQEMEASAEETQETLAPEETPGEESSPEAAAAQEVVEQPAEEASGTAEAAVEEVPHEPTAAEKRAAEREAKRAARIAAREARWAELDARDAAKAAKKEARKLERKRKLTRKALILQKRQDEKDAAKLEKYKAKYAAKKAKEDADKKDAPDPPAAETENTSDNGKDS